MRIYRKTLPGASSWSDPFQPHFFIHHKTLQCSVRLCRSPRVHTLTADTNALLINQAVQPSSRFRTKQESRGIARKPRDAACYFGILKNFNYACVQMPTFLLPVQYLISPICSAIPISYKMANFRIDFGYFLTVLSMLGMLFSNNR